MSRPSILWRAILRTERAMPWASAVTTPDPDPRTRARRQRWVVLAAMLPSVMIGMMQVLMHRAEMTAAWPIWQPMFVQLALVAAGAFVVAALAFGAIAYRRARAVPHA